MTDASICGDDCLRIAKELVKYLEEGNASAAENSLEELSALRESQLFQELGKLTRELHDTLANFQLDSKMAELAASDIPDAKERLNHVISMTEQSADRTLGAVEQLQPLSDELVSKIATLRTDWARFKSRDMVADEFRSFSRKLDQFFDWTEENMPAFNSRLTEILMAQDFQDLTGQIIRRVITLVQDVESGLVDLIRITGEKSRPSEETAKVNPIEATGPAVPGVDKGDIVQGQDDVDDLLSSLGF